MRVQFATFASFDAFAHGRGELFLGIEEAINGLLRELVFGAMPQKRQIRKLLFLSVGQ